MERMAVIERKWERMEENRKKDEEAKLGRRIGIKEGKGVRRID